MYRSPPTLVRLARPSRLVRALLRRLQITPNAGDVGEAIKVGEGAVG